jgi:uncharacterized protein (UPF0254 family)
MPLRRPSSKKGGIVEKRLLVGLPMELYKAVKVYAVEKETTVKEIVAEALRKHLGIKEGGESGKK